MRIDALNLNRLSGWETVTARTEQNTGFADLLKQALNDVQSLEGQNNQNNYLLASGQMDNLHSVMIDLEKADVALQFTLQVRNRIIEAYQEIMRMQL